MNKALKQVALWIDTVEKLNSLKLCEEESYNGVIRRVVEKYS